MLNIECALCDSNMVEEKRELEIKRDGYTLRLSGIKAYVCPKCGNIEYMAKDIKMAEEMCRTLSQTNINLKEDYLDVSEIADILSVSNQTVYNMIKDKRLQPVKIGRKWRFMKSDIDTLLNNDNDYRMAARGLDNSISNNDLDEINKYLESENE